MATPNTEATLDQLHALLNSTVIIDSGDIEGWEAVEAAAMACGGLVAGLLAVEFGAGMAGPPVHPLIEGDTDEGIVARVIGGSSTPERKPLEEAATFGLGIGGVLGVKVVGLDPDLDVGDEGREDREILVVDFEVSSEDGDKGPFGPL